MGYFQPEERDPKPLALFMIRRLFQQLAASEEPRKVTDGLAALTTWDRRNTVQLRTALQGFRDPLQRLPPLLSAKARESLVALKAKVEDNQVKNLVEEILREAPVPGRD